MTLKNVCQYIVCISTSHGTIAAEKSKGWFTVTFWNLRTFQRKEDSGSVIVEAYISHAENSMEIVLLGFQTKQYGIQNERQRGVTVRTRTRIPNPNQSCMSIQAGSHGRPLPTLLESKHISHSPSEPVFAYMGWCLPRAHGWISAQSSVPLSLRAGPHSPSTLV